MNLLYEEIKKITRRKQFFIMTIVLFGAVFLDFYATCGHYYGNQLSLVPSAYQSIIIYNYFPTPISIVFEGFIFPLAVSIIASDIYYDEKVLGINNLVVTRISRKTYVYYKIWSIIIVVFIVTTLPLLINILLSLIAFPVQGYYTCFTTPFKLLMRPDKTKVLASLDAWYPYLHVFVFLCIRGVFAVSSAIFAFSISFAQKANKYFILLSAMIFYIIYELLISFIGEIPLLSDRKSEIILTNILGVNIYGSIWMIILYFCIQISISTVLIWKGIKSDDL
ncbi:hypothetical protein [Anaerovorax odorimutans]|uniref:hypothetical protein n=1 Tax=Anaerovorax odorimutans TaxID=109327 RepID=UPI0003F813C4|nr:hypothetical protein [Anaerovorax odorimutans]